MRRISWLLSVFYSSSLFASVSPLPFFTAHDFTPVFEIKETREEFAKVSAFQFINQNNQPVTDEKLSGKISIVNFFFTQCNGICPTLMSNLRNLHEKVKNSRDVQMLSFSITPTHDTPEKLREFAKTRRIDLMRWDLITGDQQNVLEFAKKVFKADKATNDKSPDQFVHSDTVFLIDGSNHIRGIYRGQKPSSLQDLVKDIQRLRLELRGS